MRAARVGANMMLPRGFVARYGSDVADVGIAGEALLAMGDPRRGSVRAREGFAGLVLGFCSCGARRIRGRGTADASGSSACRCGS